MSARGDRCVASQPSQLGEALIRAMCKRGVPCPNFQPRAARRVSLVCQTSKTRVRARLDIRTERLAHTSHQGARSASEMQSCWLDNSLVSPSQVFTHAARAAAKQLNNNFNFRHLWWPRAARAKGSG